MEAGVAHFNPYDKPSTRDPPYGGCGLPKDKFEASSAHHIILNYDNHNEGSHGP